MRYSMLFLHLLLQGEDFRFVHLEGSEGSVPDFALGERVNVQGQAALMANDDDVEAAIDLDIDAVGLVGKLLSSVCGHMWSFLGCWLNGCDWSCAEPAYPRSSRLVLG